MRLNDTDEEAINLIWHKLHAYAEDSLGGMIGNGDYDDPDTDTTYADEWAEICEAMAQITEQLMENGQ